MPVSAIMHGVSLIITEGKHKGTFKHTTMQNEIDQFAIDLFVPFFRSKFQTIFRETGHRCFDLQLLLLRFILKQI